MIKCVTVQKHCGTFSMAFYTHILPSHLDHCLSEVFNYLVFEESLLIFQHLILLYELLILHLSPLPLLTGVQLGTSLCSLQTHIAHFLQTQISGPINFHMLLICLHISFTMSPKAECIKKHTL